VEIPSRLSTTGETPLYDLRFRWTQARHIATLQRAGLSQRLCPGTPAARSDRLGLACCFENSTGIIRIRALLQSELRSKMFGQESGRCFWICERVLPRLKVSPQA
jgi:hypothetical protein